MPCKGQDQLLKFPAKDKISYLEVTFFGQAMKVTHRGLDQLVQALIRGYDTKGVLEVVEFKAEGSQSSQSAGCM